MSEAEYWFNHLRPANQITAENEYKKTQEAKKTGRVTLQLESWAYINRMYLQTLATWIKEGERK